MKQCNNAAESAGQQSIEQLQSRYQKLHTLKIQSETNLQHVQQRLESLRADARRQFGTDDVDQLRRRLAALVAENESKRSAYQADLDRIEADLAAVEQRFNAADPSTGGGQSLDDAAGEEL